MKRTDLTYGSKRPRGALKLCATCRTVFAVNEGEEAICCELCRERELQRASARFAEFLELGGRRT